MKRTFLADRAIYSFGAVALLLGMVLPGLVPAFASAAQLSTRSIKMSSSAADASGVTYEVSFTPSAAFQSLAVDFCSDSPIAGQTCTAPPGFAFSAPTVTFTTNTIGTVSTTGTSTPANHLAISGTTQAAASAVVFNVTGVHNPTAVGSFYARIVTYDTTSNWSATNTPGAHVDDGGIALSTTNSVAVTAAVREKLSFCVSANNGTGASCAGMGALPNLELGEGATPKALDSGAISTGSVYTQIATNASSGAIVRMTSNNSCGGLHRNGAGVGVCDIAPVNSGGNTAAAIVAGNAVFGMKVGSIGAGFAPGGTTNGAINSVAPYNDGTNYGMYVDGTNGVNSSYGSIVYNTNSAPIDDYNVPLNFATSINNSTPAGIYTATLNLVATGTF